MLCRAKPHLIARHIACLWGPVPQLQTQTPLVPTRVHWLEGERINDRYEMMECIGEGGTAVVYRARDMRFDRVVAIKVPREAHINPLQRERLVREANLVSALSHPGIVQLYDLEFMASHGRQLPFLVMEYLSGRSLHDYLGEGRKLIWLETKHWLERILDGLLVAHRAGVIHRDIKPSNVLLTAERRVVLLDFGIGFQETTQGQRLTPDGAVLGTPSYLAPELLLGRDSARHAPALDVYAMGVMAFRMLTGTLPFTREFPAMIGQILYEPAPLVHILEPSVPRAMSDLVARCLLKEPAARFQDAGEMREALRSI